MPDSEQSRTRRISLIVDQWIVFWLLFRMPAYYDLLTQNRDTAMKLADTGLLTRFQFCSAHCEWSFGWLDEACRPCKAPLRGRPGHGSRARILHAAVDALLSWESRGFRFLGRASAAKVAAALGHQLRLRWYSWSFAAASWAYSCAGRFGEALSRAQSELSIAEQYGDNSLVAFAHFITSFAHTQKGEFTKAIEHAEIAVDEAPTLADKVWAQTFLGHALCRGGYALKAATLLASLVPNYDASRVVLAQVFANAWLGEAYWRAGQFDLAKATLENGLALDSRVGMKFFAGSMHRLLGEIALASNPAQLAEPLASTHFEASLAILSHIKADNELAFAYAGYGRLHKLQGQIEEAAIT